MTHHLELVRENAYLKLGIINLIEAIEKNKDLREIQRYLKDVIDGVDANITREEAEKSNKQFIESLLQNGSDEE